ncbi:MAG: YggS family pyridoxal phosphate-dependent enzyme [Candidatus Goldbacteria bacterium]|nr:YggS family pyridoxal phosphate-dependent enzyme [Candidatus Goldiibacteriota bacterium]
MDNFDIVKNNIEKIRSNILSFGFDIKIIAVTKTVSLENIEKAIKCGIIDLGENKVQEMLPKIEILKNKYKNLKFHFIGHLQTNKVNKIVGKVDLIQSVDSFKLAEKISNYAEKMNIIQDILLELKTSEEETKFGIKVKNIFKEYEAISKLKNIRIKGIMTMAPYFDNPEETRPYFKKAKDIFDEIKKRYENPVFEILSMGMTNDYLIALQEGSNMIRIGTGIFGKRGV